MNTDQQARGELRLCPVPVLMRTKTNRYENLDLYHLVKPSFAHHHPHEVGWTKVEGERIIAACEEANTRASPSRAGGGVSEAARALIAFGRPKEGSDRYKAAWDGLTAALQAVNGGGECQKCGGQGGGEIDRVSPPGMEHYTEWIDCDSCNGSGKAKP